MAVAVASSSTATWAEGSVSFTKPSGLAVGDLMVLCLVFSTGDTVSTPSGWTNITNDSGTFGSGVNTDVSTFRKVADSSDVAASTFSFDVADTTGSLLGILYRVTGQNDVNTIGGSTSDADAAVSSTTRSFDITYTPAQTNSLFFAVVGVNALRTAVTFSSNGSPTWTNAFETQDSTQTYAFAYMTYPSTTQITNVSIGYSGGGANQGVMLLFEVRNRVDAPGTVALHSADADFFAPSPSSSTFGTVAALHSADADLFTPTARGASPTQWTQTTKPSTTWTQTNKYES